MHIIRQWKCFLTCWGLRKPKYEPFITHIRGTLKDKNDKGRTWQWGIFLQLWKLLEVVKHWRKTYGFACLLQMFFKEKYYFCYFITQNRVLWLLWSIISIINTFNATWHLIKYRSILWRKSLETSMMNLKLFQIFQYRYVLKSRYFWQHYADFLIWILLWLTTFAKLFNIWPVHCFSIITYTFTGLTNVWIFVYKIVLHIAKLLYLYLRS